MFICSQVQESYRIMTEGENHVGLLAGEKVANLIPPHTTSSYPPHHDRHKIHFPPVFLKRHKIHHDDSPLMEDDGDLMSYHHHDLETVYEGVSYSFH